MNNFCSNNVFISSLSIGLRIDILLILCLDCCEYCGSEHGGAHISSAFTSLDAFTERGIVGSCMFLSLNIYDSYDSSLC